MRAVRNRIGVQAVVIPALVAVSVRAAGLSDGRFAYQGQLKEGGVPVNATCDMRFSLWNDPDETDPAIGQVGEPLFFNDDPLTGKPVQVENGLFTVALDFGTAAFGGQDRWLEVEIDCARGEDTPLIPLSPRQPVRAAPYSISTRGIHVDESGRVGIGTTTPTSALHLRTSDDVIGLRLKTPNSWTAELRQTDASFLSLVNGGSERLTVKYNGNVGIGTTTPSARLDVRGSTNPQLTIESTDSSGDDAALSIRGSRNASTTADVAYIDLRNFDNDEGTNGTDYAVGRVAGGMQDASGQTGNLRFKTNDGTGLAERMRIDANGNVGIGVLDPSARLDVNGHVKVGGEVIIPPTTRYLMISAADMVPRVSSMEVYRAFGDVVSFFTPPGQETTLYAPIHLPDGAEITELRARLADNAADQDVFVWIEKYHRNGGVLTLAIIYTQGTPGLIEVVDDTIETPVIDNSAYAYYLVVSFTVPPDDGETHLRVRPVRIAYEVTSMLP